MSEHFQFLLESVRHFDFLRSLLIAMTCMVAFTVQGRGEGEAPTVGIEGKLEVLLPGPELKAKPPERNSPVVVRIASTRPHGTLISYDIRYIGLIPGRHDLRGYLQREDGTPAQDLPPIEVTVTGLLPVQHQGQLALAPRSMLSALGGYRWVMGGLVLVWILTSVPLFLMGRDRKGPIVTSADTVPPTVAERLRPLVELAGAGKLTTSDKAELERLLLGYWRQRLGLEALGVPEALARLREHSEAGALLRSLEDWLHRPPGAAAVDVEAVLAPYAKPEGGAIIAGRPEVPTTNAS